MATGARVSCMNEWESDFEDFDYFFEQLFYLLIGVYYKGIPVHIFSLQIKPTCMQGTFTRLSRSSQTMHIEKSDFFFGFYICVD